MQFMSQSMGFADCVALAMAPIGVITIIVSAIRVAGPTWLKAIIGRARENLSTAEIELMSSTSNEACELWNGSNVVRCPRSGQILQFICLVPKVGADRYNPGVPWPVQCMSLEEATKAKASDGASEALLQKKGSQIIFSKPTVRCLLAIEVNIFPRVLSWLSSMTAQKSRNDNPKSFPSGTLKSGLDQLESGLNSQELGSNAQQSGDSCHESSSQSNNQQMIIVRDTDDKCAPNVSLNCHNQSKRSEIYLVAASGVLIQIAVLIYQGFAALKPALRHHLLKDDKPVHRYAFPLTVSGTIILTVGVLVCGFVVEQRTHESYYRPNSGYSAYVIWLQKESIMNDQEFKPFAIGPTSERSFITVSRRIENKKNHEDSKEKQQNPSVIIGRLKFLTTVGCFVSLSGFVLQFMGLRAMNYTAAVAQFVAMAIMTILRAWVRRGLVEAPESEKLQQGFELDWLANTLGLARPGWTPMKKGRHTRQDTSNDEPYPSLYSTSRTVSKQRANNIWAIRQELGNFVGWRGRASNQALLLSAALEAVGSKLLKQSVKFDVCPQRNLWKLEFCLELEDGKWKARPDRIEAAISLWMASMQNKETSRDTRKVEPEDNQLRVHQTQQLGLRILGNASHSHVLMRSLHFLVPGYVFIKMPDVLRVEKTKKYTGKPIPSHCFF